MAAVVSLGILVLIKVSYVNTVNIDVLLRTGYLNTRDRLLLSPGKGTDLKESDINEYLDNFKRSDSDLKRPSSEFMIHLFRDLIRGKVLTDAVGHTHGQTRNYISNSDTVRSFSPRTMEEGRYKFTFPVLPVQETPQVAEIRLNQPHHTFNKWKITVVMPRRSGLHHGSTKFFRKTLPYRKDGVWDISSVIIPLLDHFRGNITMELKATHLKKIGRENRVVPKDPIVVLYSTDKSFLGEIKKLKSDLNSTRSKSLLRSRTKRTAQEHKTGRKRRRNKWKQNKNGTELCKLHKFRVDFDLIGWGRWIVHPKKFNAKACFGQCPAPITHEYTPTNHAMLQTLMRMKRPLSAPEPCCVPTKLRPLSMLYFEYDDIVVRYHQDMVAAECGCR